jgi:hypothetical protein
MLDGRMQLRDLPCSAWIDTVASDDGIAGLAGNICSAFLVLNAVEPAMIDAGRQVQRRLDRYCYCDRPTAGPRDRLRRGNSYPEPARVDYRQGQVILEADSEEAIASSAHRIHCAENDPMEWHIRHNSVHWHRLRRSWLREYARRSAVPQQPSQSQLSSHCSSSTDLVVGSCILSPRSDSVSSWLYRLEQQVLRSTRLSHYLRVPVRCFLHYWIAGSAVPLCV